MRLIWKLIAKVYSQLLFLGFPLSPVKQMFNQPATSLPYTYTETLRGDINFNNTERELILQAIHDWEYFNNGFFRVNISFDLDPAIEYDGTDGQILKVDIDHKDVVKADGYYKTTIYGLCLYQTIKDTGYIKRRLMIVSERLENPFFFKAVVIHEIGHYLWLSHIKKRGIMHDYINGNTPPYLTMEDAKEYGSKFNIDIENLRYFLG